MSEWMNNLYLINTILNTISTTFTLLFLLYRFTSLFSYIVGFVKFCGKLFNGIVYLKNTALDYYYNRTGHINEDIEYGLTDSHDNNNDDYYTSDGVVYRSVYSNETFFSKFKNKVYSFIYPKKNEYNSLPIYQTRSSYIINSDDPGYNQNDTQTDNCIEQNIINQQLNNLLDEEDDESVSSVPLLWFDQQSPHNSAHNSAHNRAYNQYDPLGNYNYNKLTPTIPVTNHPTTPVTNPVTSQGDLNSEYNNYFKPSLNKPFNNEFKQFNNEFKQFSNEFKPFNDFDKPPFNNNFNSSNSSNSSNIINWYNTMDAIPAFVNPNTFVNPNVFVTPGNIFVNKIDNTGNHSGIGSDINLNGISDQSESDYNSEYKSEYKSE